MIRHIKFAAAMLAVVGMTTSCSKLGNLTADNFTVTPTPLVEQGGVVTATINGTFPEKYMKRKAVVTVTPVLKFDGREVEAVGQTFQGEKVLGNDQTISYRMGGNYVMRRSWDYDPAMMNSELYLRFTARVGNRVVNIPEVKVSYGVVATEDLLGRTLSSTNAAVAPDDFQRVIANRVEANIRFLVNQAQLRQSELRSTSVQDFVNMLREINADQERLALDGIEVSAYASPEGRLAWNEQLAERRQNASADYVRRQMQAEGIDYDIDTRYTAEDWDGFQQLVAASNIQDKDLILRVLSMYNDPEEREAQIRNMSAVFTELAEGILPELRRARLIINYQVIGRDDEQIVAQYAADPAQLSIEELVYGANMLVDSQADRVAWNQTIVRLFPNDYRAYNNLAAIAYANGDLTAMENYLNQAAERNATAAEINTNRALLNLRRGNVEDALTYIGRGTQADAYNEVLGNLNIASGNYAQAATALAGKRTNSAALAQILNNDYSAAAATLAAVRTPDATTDYLLAVLAARTNDAAGVANNLRRAVAKDPSLATRAKQDLEFARFAATVMAL